MNLDPLDEHSDDELWRVLELAHLSGYIRKQMLGLQHPVDQSGSNFRWDHCTSPRAARTTIRLYVVRVMLII